MSKSLDEWSESWMGQEIERMKEALDKCNQNWAAQAANDAENYGNTLASQTGEIVALRRVIEQMRDASQHALGMLEALAQDPDAGFGMQHVVLTWLREGVAAAEEALK